MKFVEQILGQKMNKRRRTVTAILAAILALLILVPILITIISSVTASAVSKSELDDLKAEADALEEKQQEIENKLSSIDNAQAALAAKKQLMDEQIYTTRAEIENMTAQITVMDAQINEKQEEYRLAQEEEAKQFGLFKERVRAMEENGNISYFSIIFEASNFGDLLSRLDFISEIMEYDETIVTNLEDAQALAEQSRHDLEDSKTDAEAYRSVQYQMEAELEAQVASSIELYAELENNADAYRLAYEENEKLEEELSEQIDDMIEKLERQAAQGNSNVVSTGTYIWPSNDSRYITSLFGNRLHPILGYYKNHNGIDIGASYGTAILASDSGSVVTSDYSSSYGNYIMIAHGNGRYTLYAHMSERYSSVGDSVSQGDTIGLCGSTGWSTGAHIHFEIYEGGVRVNPLNYFSNYEVSPNA